MRREMGADGCAEAEHRAINNGLPVNGMGKRLTDQRIVNGRQRVDGRQDRFPFG